MEARPQHEALSQADIGRGVLSLCLGRRTRGVSVSQARALGCLTVVEKGRNAWKDLSRQMPAFPIKPNLLVMHADLLKEKHREAKRGMVRLPSDDMAVCPVLT